MPVLDHLTLIIDEFLGHKDSNIDAPILNLAKSSPDLSKCKSGWPSKIKSRGHPNLILDAPISNLAKSSPDLILGHLNSNLDGHLRSNLGILDAPSQIRYWGI